MVSEFIMLYRERHALIERSLKMVYLMRKINGYFVISCGKGYKGTVWPDKTDLKAPPKGPGLVVHNYMF